MKTKKLLMILVLAFGLTVWLPAVSNAAPLSTAFTYQGHLYDNNDVANDLYDFQFKLYDSIDPCDSNQIGSDANIPDIDVIDGYFTVELDFGSGVFDGNAVWLEIGIRPGDQNDPNGYSALSPPQPLTATPYSLQTRGIFVDDGGNVGIGTTTPDNALDVEGGVAIGTGFAPSTVANPNGLIVSGPVEFGTSRAPFQPTHPLTVSGSPDIEALHLLGPGDYQSQARLTFGDEGRVFIEEDTDDTLRIHAETRTAITGGNVGIGTTSPSEKLEVAGNVKADAFLGDGSGLTGVSRVGSTVDLENVALLRWDLLNRNFPVGTGPQGVAFDGTNIWVANNGSSNVTKLRASDGANLGTFPAGSYPRFVAFDGANIWVSNELSNNVTKLRASDGANLGTFPVGSFPEVVVFDGASIWVANLGNNNVTKLRASDGANLGTFPVGTAPVGIAFDGTNIWVANQGSNNVTKLRASDGANLGTFPAGSFPRYVAFDGANIWVANASGNSVTKLRASDGANLGTFPVGTSPLGVAFDGANIWVANWGNNNVTRISLVK